MYIHPMFRPAGMGVALALLCAAAPCAAQTAVALGPDTLLTATVPLDGTVVEPTFTLTADAAGDTARWVWRRVDLSVPAGWTCDACDTGECYGGVPIGADFPPIPPGSSGFLKLILSSPGTEGSGFVHFYVHPEGFFDLGADLYVVFASPGLVGTSDLFGSAWSCVVLPDALRLRGLPAGTPFALRDLAGRSVASGVSTGPDVVFPLPGGAPGIHVLTCQMPAGPASLKLFLP